MNTNELLSLFNTFNPSTPVEFFQNLIITIVLALILSQVYKKFGGALSNRNTLAGTFVLLAITTMMVISIIKSSLALSLGLVGALSIVRFRAAIKEPEELTYLFFIIAIGLGMGAGAVQITIIFFFFAVVFIVVRGMFKGSSRDDKNLYLSVQSMTKTNVNTKKILEILKKHCSYLQLKRMDEDEAKLEYLYNVKFSSVDKMLAAQQELRALDKKIRVSLIEDINIIH